MLSDQFKYNEKTKLVTRINGNCYPCIYELKIWTNFIERVYKNCINCELQFYFYIACNDTNTFNIINNNEIGFNHPIMFDTKNDFHKLNKLNENYLFHTMLLDSLNRVILIGSPIMNEKLQELYISEIISINSH